MSLLQQAIAARVERGEFPGVVALVARGEEVMVHTVGVTRFGGDIPMRRGTPFRIASMTKPVLAVAAMMLAEAGRLDLEEPVAKLLPEIAGQRVLARPDAPLDETVPAAPTSGAPRRCSPTAAAGWPRRPTTSCPSPACFCMAASPAAPGCSPSTRSRR